jgi:hypothetical protein
MFHDDPDRTSIDDRLEELAALLAAGASIGRATAAAIQEYWADAPDSVASSIRNTNTADGVWVAWRYSEVLPEALPMEDLGGVSVPWVGCGAFSAPQLLLPGQFTYKTFPLSLPDEAIVSQILIYPSSFDPNLFDPLGPPDPEAWLTDQCVGSTVPKCHGLVTGDLNLDDAWSPEDLPAMLSVILDPNGAQEFKAAHGLSDEQYLCLGDFNGDGVVWLGPASASGGDPMISPDVDRAWFEPRIPTTRS